MASTWGASWGSSWGASWDVSTAVVVIVTSRLKPAGPAPGSYAPRKYYLPPGWKKKKPSVEEVKKLYVKAREEIPPKQQKGLLPLSYRLEGSSVARLPPPRLVDFEKLRNDLSGLRALLAEAQRVAEAKAVFEARQMQIAEAMRAAEEHARRTRKRRKEEEILLLILLNL